MKANVKHQQIRLRLWAQRVGLGALVVMTMANTACMKSCSRSSSDNKANQNILTKLVFRGYDELYPASIEQESAVARISVPDTAIARLELVEVRVGKYATEKAKDYVVQLEERNGMPDALIISNEDGTKTTYKLEINPISTKLAPLSLILKDANGKRYEAKIAGKEVMFQLPKKLDGALVVDEILLPDGASASWQAGTEVFVSSGILSDELLVSSESGAQKTYAVKSMIAKPIASNNNGYAQRKYKKRSSVYSINRPKEQAVAKTQEERVVAEPVVETPKAKPEPVAVAVVETPKAKPEPVAVAVVETPKAKPEPVGVNAVKSSAIVTAVKASDLSDGYSSELGANYALLVFKGANGEVYKSAVDTLKKELLVNMPNDYVGEIKLDDLLSSNKALKSSLKKGDKFMFASKDKSIEKEITFTDEKNKVMPYKVKLNRVTPVGVKIRTQISGYFGGGDLDSLSMVLTPNVISKVGDGMQLRITLGGQELYKSDITVSKTDRTAMKISPDVIFALRGKENYGKMIKAEVLTAQGESVGADSVKQTQYEIRTLNDLKAVSYDLSGNYIQMNDVTYEYVSAVKKPAPVAKAPKPKSDSEEDEEEEEEEVAVQEEEEKGDFGFKPIGDEDEPFAGTFDGQGFYINNFYIDRPQDPYVGMFRNINEDAVLKNININIRVEKFVQGAKTVGALVALNMGGTITGCFVKGEIISNDVVGGLVGYNAGSILKSSVDVEVKGKAFNGIAGFVGGLVGYNYAGVVDSCAVKGDINAGKSAFVGGLIGKNYSGSITSSNAKAFVAGLNAAGGLIGYNSKGVIAHCSVDSENVQGGLAVGGLIGINEEGDLTFCSAIATVKGQLEVGGLVGRNKDNSVINACYASANVRGQKVAGGLVGYNEKSMIISSYTSGNVFADKNAAEFIGMNKKGNVSASYSTGKAFGKGADNYFVSKNNGKVSQCFYLKPKGESKKRGFGEGVANLDELVDAVTDLEVTDLAVDGMPEDNKPFVKSDDEIGVKLWWQQ